jgi:hypothetical protein
MNRILAALLLVALSLPAFADVQRARYGVAETFNFRLYNADGTLDVDEADGGTEVSLSCDEGAETTATNDFADEGTFYSIALTAAELKCERVAVVIAATTTEVFHIQTSALDPSVVAFGTAQSATGTTLVLAAATSFADDILNCATILITGGTGAGQSRPISDWTSASDTATVPTWTTNPDNTSVYEVYGTSCASGTVSIGTGGITASSFASGAIDATAIAADAIGASELATDAIGAAEIAADAIAASEIATDAIGAAEIAASAIGASEIADGGITSTEFGTGAITATVIAADAIGASELAADSITSSEVADGAIDAGAIATDAIGAAELAADAIGASEIATGAIDAAATAADFSTEVQDVDVESINGALVCGDGTDGTPWADCP